MRDKIRFDVYKELKIVNIESLFFAFLLEFTLVDSGLSPIVGAAAGLVLILGIKLLFRFKIGYFLVSTVFSGFWAIAFGSGWLRDGNWLVGGGLALGIFVKRSLRARLPQVFLWKVPAGYEESEESISGLTCTSLSFLI